jgi:hypothetical protein
MTLLAISLAVTELCPGRAAAQSTNISVSSPVQRLGDSFFERIGTDFGWGIRGRRGGAFFNQGSFESALPPFGGHNPAADAYFGYGMRSNNADLSFGLAAGQGSSRSIISQAPSVTMSNGGVAGVADGMLQPFVTGIIPVVGAFRASPLLERLHRLRSLRRQQPSAAAEDDEPMTVRPPDRRSQPTPLTLAAPGSSTAERGDISVAEIRARQAAEEGAKQREVQGLIAKAQRWEQAGNAGVASIYYRQAASRATGSLQRELQEKVKSLTGPREKPPSR